MNHIEQIIRTFQPHFSDCQTPEHPAVHFISEYYENHFPEDLALLYTESYITQLEGHTLSDALTSAEPTLTINQSSGREPTIEDLILNYYSIHFDAERARQFTDMYISNTLKNEG